MTHAAKNPQQNVIAIIPARFSSTRLEGKLLLPIAGKPLIIWTIEQAKKARNIDRVIVATDDERILNAVRESKNEAVLTSSNHQSGSDRIAEVAANLPENSIIVNVQGDEPLLPRDSIEATVEAVLGDDSIEMATICELIHQVEDVLSPNVVKVVLDNNNFALYFSRSPIPFPREAVNKYGSLENALRENRNLILEFRKHTGLYVYRREFLLKYTKANQTLLEKSEILEQLRAMENGMRIKVIEASEGSIGVDTIEDFERVRKIIEKENVFYRRANVKDALAVAKVHVKSWSESFVGIVPQKFLDNMSIEKREKVFRRTLSEINYKMFVAETFSDGIVGFADFGESRNDNLPFEGELYAIYLLPESQGKGIGENLFKFCQKEMVADGMNSMHLETLKISPYKFFYDKMGGKIVGQGKHLLANVEYETLLYGWNNLGEIYD